jgi:alpha-L-fucosidase
MLTRRQLLGACAALAAAPPGLGEDWQSLAGHGVPDWFRDAKFGIWAHWGPQCVPEHGDWYGRLMYVQGHDCYEHHLRTYGHPTRTGFLDIIGRWKAQAWDPARLVSLYRKAGARYFVAMANHHDNFDNFDSAHHEWNSVRIGPRKDIVGIWAKAARAAGLRFGVSNHSAHAWHWWQTAYGYDAQGPMRGRRYDAFRLRKADGRGTWWEGLDPQDLYTGPAFAPPNGIATAKAMNAWHDARDGQWMEYAPPQNPRFAAKWLLRQKDLVEKYRPDLVYLDDSRLPFGRIGIEAAAHYYAHAPDGVLTAKQLSPFQRHALVEDVERGFVDGIRDVPWQTDTCLGNWHYDRRLFDNHGYKTAKQVVQRLADVVSKNGNLLLSVPVRGDGTIDSDEEAILASLSAWFERNGEAIYGSRPWRVFGEGPTRVRSGVMNEGEAAPFTSDDVRYTARGANLYAILLDWPERPVLLAALPAGAAAVERVEMLGGPPVDWAQDAAGLRLTLPRPPSGQFVPVVRLRVRGPVAPPAAQA